MYTLTNSNAAFYHRRFCCCGNIRSISGIYCDLSWIGFIKEWQV